MANVFKFEFYFPPEESPQYEAAAAFLKAFADHLEKADVLGIEVTGHYHKEEDEGPQDAGKATQALEETAASTLEAAPSPGDDGIPIITIRACPGKRP